MTPPYYEDAGLRLWHGSNKDVLPAIADSSYDSIVTDPPYELGFMGKGWDSSGIAYDVELWREAYRVLKPGGHLLAFGGSRTWHRLAAAIEDAGFEIRDSIAWLYGSGFPKSLDVAKAIDKVRDDVDDVRIVCRWLRARIDESEHTVKSLAEYFGFHPRMVEHWAARDSDSQPSLPTLAQWDMLRGALGFSDEVDPEVYRLNMRKGEPGEAWKDREVLGEQTAQAPGFMGKRFTARDTLVRGEGSDASKTWDGWGTALKPAFEPIVVARKPLIGTVARNVLVHGTGALNVDASRVPYRDEADRKEATDKNQHATFGTEPGGNEVYGDFSMVAAKDCDSSNGRWPTNVVMDGSQSDAAGHQGRIFPTFRYEAKAGSAERPKVDGVQHATVKPLDLMRWLVRLVTRPGGRVLDLFAGSGTTGEAALLEGMEVDLIELEADHLPLILARVRKPLQPSMFGDWDEAIA